MIDFKEIGKSVQRIRKSQNMTQAELAEQLSVTVGYISQIERGSTKVNLETLGKLSDALHCTLYDFLASNEAPLRTKKEAPFTELLQSFAEQNARTDWSPYNYYNIVVKLFPKLSKEEQRNFCCLLTSYLLLRSEEEKL